MFRANLSIIICNIIISIAHYPNTTYPFSLLLIQMPGGNIANAVGHKMNGSDIEGKTVKPAKQEILLWLQHIASFLHYMLISWRF